MKPAGWAGLLGVSGVLGIAGPTVVSRVAALRPDALAGNPYWIPGHAMLLYLLVPLSVVGITILCLAPGMLLTERTDVGPGGGGTWERWILCGGLVSVPVISIPVGLVQGVTGWSPTGSGFVAILLALSAAAFLLGSRSRPVAAGGSNEPPGAALLPLVTLVVAVLLLLLPKFFWESFNGDGAHGYESARLLLSQPLPFFPAVGGRPSGFPGVTSLLFAYPGSWWIRVLGEGAGEAGARLPFVVHLALLYCALVVVAETGGNRLARTERWLVVLSLLGFTVTMAFSATYDPYAADLALPATQDTLAMVCVLGFIWANLERRVGWELLCGTMALLALPNGLLLIAFWLTAAWLMSVTPWKRTVIVGAAALAMAGLLALAFPVLAVGFGTPRPGQEYGLLQLLSRFGLLQFTDWHRVLYVLLPAGILPGLALCAWRRQDQVARALTLVVVAYFLFFYLQARISLHHFVPAMLLPIPVLWRVAGRWTDAQAGIRIAGLSAGLLAVLLVAPPGGHRAVHQASREVGTGVLDRLGAAGPYDAPRQARRALLQALLPEDWRPEVPDSSYGGSSFAWYYYSAHREPGAPARHVIQPLADPVPAGMVLWSSDGTYALYTSLAAREQEVARRPPTPPGSTLLQVQRGILFGGHPPPVGVRLYSLEGLLRRLGVDVEALKRRVAGQ